LGPGRTRRAAYLIAFSLALVVTLHFALTRHSAKAPPERPGSALAATSSARTFFNSVGVNTHVSDGNTAYGDWPRLLTAIDDLGIKHVRDGVYGNPSSAYLDQYFQSRVEQAVSHGIGFDFIMGAPDWDGGTVDQLVSVLSGPVRNAVEAVEDPNEWDTTNPPNFASRLSAYDQQVYTAMKANSSLNSVPVIGPSLVGQNAPAQLGNQQAWLDYGNIHPYLGGSSPTPENTAWELQQIRAVSGQKPVWATEIGYYNALNASAELRPVPEDVAAVYLLRQYLENFKDGIARTYAYELIDDNSDPGGTDPQQHFGLLRNDYTPKPAYTAVKNLLSLVGQGQPANLTPLPLEVDNAPSDLRELVLQGANHSYTIALWRTASIWDYVNRLPEQVAPSDITLNLPSATAVSSADPVTGGTTSPLTLSNGDVQTQLGADPVLNQVATAASPPAEAQDVSSSVFSRLASHPRSTSWAVVPPTWSPVGGNPWLTLPSAFWATKPVRPVPSKRLKAPVSKRRKSPRVRPRTSRSPP